ncbi:MAG: GGDEF domain-containing protein [Xanthomonadales bacterium]|nr:GGDEF domain-containing protein [Xanthomonadales bacterium]
MVLGSSILTSLLPNYEPIAFLLFFVIIPQMWIVHTESAFRSLVSIAVLSTTIAVCTRLFDVSHYALINQFAMIIIASSAYFGMSVPVLYAHNKALQQMLRRDTLTEAASRLHFIEQSRSELSRAKRYREPVSLIVIDIDHFKQINDQLGHALGDRVLREVASVCLDTLRSSDVLGRLGGDEFAVLLPVTALDTAEDVAQRLCRALGEIDLVDGGRVVDISASLGVIEVKLDEETYEQALERADGALYEAKRAGRNRVQAG